jgi:hypothetical protein
MTTSQKSFQYSGSVQTQKLFFKSIGILVTVLLLVLVAVSLFRPSHNIYINYLGVIFAILFMLAWTFVGASFWPDVVADSKGLLVEFGWSMIRVPWERIVDIQMVKLTFVPGKFWLVRTKALTPLHRLYSLAYASSFLPGFLIHAKLENHSALIRMINNKGWKESNSK